MKALLFEDCKDRLRNFKGWFEKYNVDADFCHNANDCIELLKNNKYDIIFLDHDMERVEHGEPYNIEKHSGTVVTKWWNSPENKNQGVPVIIHSVNSDKGVWMNKTIPNSIQIRRMYRMEVFETLLELASLLAVNPEINIEKMKMTRPEIATEIWRA